MILTDMSASPWSRCWEGVIERGFPHHGSTLLPSGPMKLVIAIISVAYAQRRPAQGPEGGHTPRLAVRRGRGPLLQPVGPFPADLSARGRDGDDAAGAPPARGQPDRRRTDPGGTCRGHPRAPGGGRGRPVGDRRAG